jgi:alkylation response protein AidB-like acyl-CoA dehydrogenase
MSSVVDLQDLTRRLAGRADAVGSSRAWPAESVDIVSASGAWGWVIDPQFGGRPRVGLDRVLGYEALAAGCLTTALIVTQQHGACELIAAGDNDDLKKDVLPQLANGTAHCTLGISHLTTSKRGGTRQMEAESTSDGVRLSGTMPWSTAPAHCDYVLTAALTPDDEQVSVCLPLALRGVHVDTAMALTALDASMTTSIQCENVDVPEHYIVRGPAPKVLDRRSAIKPLTVSAVGCGMAARLVGEIERLRGKYDEQFDEAFGRMSKQFDSVRRAVHGAADGPPLNESTVPIRGAVNDLVVRLAAALMTLSKGSGYVRGQRADRLCREAHFFLVWSAPATVQSETLRHLFARW